jgi:hypothetical protein
MTPCRQKKGNEPFVEQIIVKLFIEKFVFVEDVVYIPEEV